LVSERDYGFNRMTLSIFGRFKNRKEFNMKRIITTEIKKQTGEMCKQMDNMMRAQP